MSVGMYIIKKDGTKEPFNVQKVVAAVNKSAERVLYTFKPDELDFICRFVTEKCEALGADGIMIAQMHNIVEGALDAINPAVAKSYRDYRNYKTDFVQMLDTVYKKSQSIMYIGDKENSNADSALVSTRRSLIFNQLNKQLYQKFFLTVEELQAQRDGYIYIHDMSARRDTMNCCLFDVGAVLRGGFEMGNLWYNEPKTLNVAFDVIGDIVLSAASQQYGGFTVSCVDQLLDKYAEASYIMFYDRYRSLGLSDERAQEEAMKDIVNDFEQGFQGWEYKFNTVASSRGDYPFITMTLGLGQTRMAKLASKYKVEAVLKPAKIAYRETIKKKVEIHGRHKKQSGGHGQFGDVYIRFEPQSESEEMIFADETVGGCVPKNFIPSVEKGLRNCVGKGVLAGYPVVFLKATLYFGSYHPVDSSDMAFQTAAGIAYKEGLPTAGPTLLEPIGELKVLIPDANMGDVIGDLNKRRGRVMGMNPDPENPGYQTVEAEVPMGEMSSYTIDLRAMSQGRGSYTLKFVRYEEVPQMNQAKIIEDAKKDEEEG